MVKNTSSTSAVHLRGGGRAARTAKARGVSTDKEKEDRRRMHAQRLVKRIKNLGKKLQSEEFLNTASADDIKFVEDKIARRLKVLHRLDSKNGLEVSDIAEPSQISLPNDSESEDEDQSGAYVRSKKRKLSASGFLNEEDTNGTADASEVIVIEDTPRKVRQEKMEKKQKKRKVDKSSHNSLARRNSRFAFEDSDGEQGLDTANLDARNTASQDEHAGHDISQNGTASPSPEKSRQAALIDTITRSRTRSESTGDGIYQALVAGMLAQPSPPSPMSSIADYPRSLIDIGRSAIAAPILPSTQKPIRDRAFKPQVPAASPQLGFASSHRESPILPPKRNFSSTSIVPISKENGVENKKTNKKVASTRKASHPDTNTNPEPASEESQQSATLSQTVTAIKEAASATVIEGIFSQADPFTCSKKILPPARISIPPVASHPKATNSSTPDITPTKPKSKSKSKSKSHRDGRTAGEPEDWEKTSGRVRAIIHKDGLVDDGETEENIAFSSSYIQSRPLGISISGTNFQILAIGPGTEQEELPVSTDKAALKICSVAKGRVRVLLGGGSKSFEIGEGGMWRVRGGEKCVVANVVGSREIACVHLCTVEG
ncbi:hypothetical protein ONS95_008903 [Cadophora gregata]|nr:uncharacterized protein ONS95_008903 [Cadophora gregata]KAK0123912.1 hypothetical protein ONS95_008903 [Cadophora gregata]